MDDDLAAKIRQRLSARDEPNMMEVVRTVAETPPARAFFDRLVGEKAQRAWDALAAADRLVVTMARGVAEFAPRGWAFSGLTKPKAYDEALKLLDDGAPLEAAEQPLVHVWRDQNWLHMMANRVGSMSAVHTPLKELYEGRRRLLLKAKDHHLAGRYDASILLLQAQIDGITLDLTDKYFFSTSGRRSADVVDGETLAGLDVVLPVVREFFAQPVSSTQSAGSPSRHGIVHGRELAYDTESNSAKYWALFAAVWEWSKPQLDEWAEDLERAHDARYAGQEGVDEEGQRLDRREFRATREALCRLETRQMGEFNEHGLHNAELTNTPGFMDWVAGKDLPGEHDIRFGMSPDGTTWWAWRVTPSGWVLGRGSQGRYPVFVWDAPEEPQAGPPGDGWVEPWNAPNWP